MELIRGIHNLHHRHRGCVLTIGNFDGVHLGHQAVVRQVVQQARESQARESNVASCIMVFEPQPREVLLSTQKVPARLTTLREKYTQLAKLGIDRLLVVDFTPKIASMTAAEFAQAYLIQKLGVTQLIVGDDFRFGAPPQGDFAFLQALNAFEVQNTHSFTLSSAQLTSKGLAATAPIRVSSTAIRQALHQGDFPLAKAMLGRDYAITGRVMHGAKLGRTLGFPTANIGLKRRVSPLRGVFAVRVAGVEKSLVAGVANIGMRPTVNGLETKLEVHVFDCDKSLYGKALTVQFLHKLRDEQKFSSLDALTQQITFDAQAARAWLGCN